LKTVEPQGSGGSQFPSLRGTAGGDIHRNGPVNLNRQAVWQKPFLHQQAWPTTQKYSVRVDFFLPIFYPDSPGTKKNQEAPTATNPFKQVKTGESTSSQKEARVSMT
jgi:hypothetical protein